ncbi:MAG: SPOR domain-containing protein [Pseudomonadota bacterium]|nr:SPOR domain-containing protein [Pseudomonadota bacterium]
MKQGTKQRIVGTIVIASLALIFLPIIFDGQGSHQTQTASRIPEQPVVPILPEPQQSRPVIISDVDLVVTETKPEPERVTKTIEESASDLIEVSASESNFTRDIPTLNSAGLPNGWSIRLGSFSEASNASDLMQRLQTAGYKAYIRDIDSEQVELTGVFVGPWLERALVNDYIDQLRDEFQLEGMVVRYQLKQP